VTAIFIDDLDRLGLSSTAYTATWDDSTSTVRGYIAIDSHINSDTSFTVFALNSITVATGYKKLNVTYISGATFSNGEYVAIRFYRTGDKGTTGSTGYAGSRGATGYTGSVGTTAERLKEYNVTSLNRDSNGIYTTVEYKRPADSTLFMRSVLSGGTSPNYTTDTWTFYQTNGTTVSETKTWTFTYDTDGKIITKSVV
jgi:hypothetical protein